MIGDSEMADDLERKAALVDAIGIDPASPHGEALVALHDGELTVTALAESAEGFGLLEPAGPTDELSDEDRHAIAASERSASLAALSVPVEPKTLNDEIGEAERKAEVTGDWSEFMKLQAIASERRYQRGAP